MAAAKNSAKAAAKPAPELEQDETIRVKIEGKWYEIGGQDDLTWGEVEEAEIYFGQSIDDIDMETGRGTMFMCYVARARIEPTFTIDDMKRLKVSDFEIDKTPRPTDSGDADSGTRS